MVEEYQNYCLNTPGVVKLCRKYSDAVAAVHARGACFVPWTTEQAKPEGVRRGVMHEQAHEVCAAW